MLAPCRRLRYMAHQLTLTGAATGAAARIAAARVVATGRLNPVPALDLADWVRPGDDSLSREELRRLGEILSAQWIHEGGAATGLSKGQWLERWREFHANNPGHPALCMPAAYALDQRPPTAP
jgi:hypothetical protein